MSDLDLLIARARLKRRLPDPPTRRLLRERWGLSQQQIADQVGCSRVQIARYESGTRSPGPRFLAPYAELLDRLAAELSRD
jgi:transcriptional regulator with XRE-family HTH domain